MYCGDQPKILNLTVRTHVAFGLESKNKFVYLFNQIGSVPLTAETFGKDPLPSDYKKGYCKPVTADNNDGLVFAAAMAKIKAHIDGTAVLTPAELQTQNARIAQTVYTLADKKANIIQAFSIVDAYEAKEKGAFFLNTKTKGGFPNDTGAVDGFELDRAVLAIQQSIFDSAYTPANLALYKNELIGKKFNTADWFPGAVKAAANPAITYAARINANMPANVDLPTAYEQMYATRPTGYYLAAGDLAKVTVPASMVGKGFVIQVGAHAYDKYAKPDIKRPFQVAQKYLIDKEVTEIVNPFGGGIYINVPYLANAGADVTVNIQNAVPAPFFSSTAINSTTLKQWQDVQRNNPAPWADFQSDKFMMTLPTSLINKYADPVTLLQDWDNRMDVVSDLLGHSRVRNNYVLYLSIDTSLVGPFFGIGYPAGNNLFSPASVQNGNSMQWYLKPGKDFFPIEFHELGHAQLFNNFPGEGEAAVNVLSAAISNKLYGVDIGQALSKSMGDKLHITREQAAMNWMVTPNFRAGLAMDITNSEKNEVRYQQRGYAKYIEVAALFGWDALGKFYAEENRVHREKLTPAGKGMHVTDSQILRMSIAAGVDLTPLIHFWGVQPVNGTALASAISAANLKPSLAIYDRLNTYQSLIPMDNAAFQAHAAAFLAKPITAISGTNISKDYGEGWYFSWLNTYSAAEGKAAQAAMQKVFARYFPAGKPI